MDRRSGMIELWMGVGADSRNRGVKDLLIWFCSWLKGSEEAIKASFPKAEIQKCVVHRSGIAPNLSAIKTERHSVQI